MQSGLDKVEPWQKLNEAAGGGQAALDTSLDNVDGLLSQGEPQLFCLARAMCAHGRQNCRAG
ncbi:hypothetical protein AOQ84DRAFT_129412 [Glonium stellatum]|uniref:Uncharacterized protein n=1 Tax=Glonium stellatum TaxID=574774 RepID=A0A8E2F9F4_9PEZI|nr:hypothetical protein AOQ84DRAFT_129412 [Glonium stellatum]